MPPSAVTATCSACPFLDQAAGGHCSIRELGIADGGQTFCANHPVYSPKRDQRPVGPVMLGSGEDAVVLHASADSGSIRRNLLAIAEDIEVRDLSELTFRERMALWQLQQFDDSRAYVHFDRISLDASMTPDTPRTPGALHHFLLKDTFHRLVPEHPDGNEAGVPYLERITLPARILGISSILAGAGVFYGMFLFLNENVPAGTRIPIVVIVLISVVAGIALFAGGAFAFRRMGIPFWITGDKNSVDESTGDQSAGDT